MSNPIMKLVNNSSVGGASTIDSRGSNNNLLQQFNEFKRTFKGNPRDAINNMLNSGRFSNAQIEQAKGLAKQMMSMFK